jgi:hypothetical protein
LCGIVPWILTALVSIAISRRGYGAVYGEREICECGNIVESILISPTLLVALDSLKGICGPYLEQRIHLVPDLEVQGGFEIEFDGLDIF